MARRKNFPLRLDPRLYKALQKWSADELRSVNGQIEYLLRRAVVKAGRWPPSSSESEDAAAQGGNGEDHPAKA